MTASPPPAGRPARDLLGFGLGFLGVCIFGATLPMTRIAVPSFEPLLIAVGRASIAAVLAAVLLVATRRPLPRRDTWRSLAIASACAIFGFPLFSAIAMETVPASHGGVVLGLLPLATSVAAVFVNGERPSRAFWVLGALGAAIVIAFSVQTAEGGIGAGDLALIAACASAAWGYAHFARLGDRMAGWESISWALVFSAPITVPLSLVLLEPAHFAAPWPAVGALLYVSVFSVFIGFFFWSAGLTIGGVARVGQVQLLQTFVTLAIAAALNGEPVTAETVAYAMAVVAVVLAARNQRIAKSA